MVLSFLWCYAKQGGFDQVALGYWVIDLYGLCLYGFALGPVHKIIRLVWLRLGVGVAVDIGQQCAGSAVAHIGNLFAKWLQLVVSEPFCEFIAANFQLGLSDAFAKLFG
jgi:hypothetical protein